MASKNNTEVIIDGKIYTLSGYESEEYLQKVAAYINNKISEFKKDDAYRRQNIDVQKTLLNLNIADDYFKAKKQADALENELESKDKQLYDIKHELVAAQINLETNEKEQEELKKQLDDAQKEIIRLEARIAEMKENQAKEPVKTTRRSSQKSSQGKNTAESSSGKNDTKNLSVNKKSDETVHSKTSASAEAALEALDNPSENISGNTAVEAVNVSENVNPASKSKDITEADKILSSLGDVF